MLTELLASLQARSTWATSRATWLALAGSMWLLRMCFVARLHRFAARTCSPGPLQDALGLDFRARNTCFFEAFACHELSMGEASNIEKTL